MVAVDGVPNDIPEEFILKPDVRDDQNEGEVYNTPSIGIIYPPPELRNIVDKTASFVARNGTDFEARIRQNEANNPKFNFLNHGDPYHAYYEHKVEEFMQGKAQEPQVQARPYSPPPIAPTNMVQEKLRRQLDVITLKDPPPEFEFFADAPTISSFDLEVVRLTAQCVAKNGRDFLAELMDKESKNFQFDFLKPQHSLFDYFTKLVEQYTKILLPPRAIVADLRSEAARPRKVLEDVRYRAEWYRRDLREKEREDEENEKERVAYAQIDWHDFTIVETIDYQQWEEGEFPAPTTPEEVGARSLLYERMLQEQQQQQSKQTTVPATEADDITVEMEIEEEEMAPQSPPRAEPKEAPQPIPVPPPSMPPPVLAPVIPGNIIIRPYDPRARTVNVAPKTHEMVKSSITGENVPVAKLSEHLRYSLLDPEHLQQRDRQIMDKMNQEQSLATGSDISQQLRQLAERRSDIFGSGAEETSIGRKIGDASKEQERKVVWDGFVGSTDSIMRQAAKNVTPEEQRHHQFEMAKAQGLVPDPEKDKIGPQTTVSVPLPPPVATPLLPPSLPANISVPAPPPVKLPSFAPPPTSTSMLRPPGMGMSFLPPTPAFLPPVQPLLPKTSAPPVISAPLPEPDDDDEDEPAAKRQKQDNAAEEEFLQLYKGPITFKVQVPHVADKSEWKLNGQMLSLTLLPTDTVTDIKTKIQDQLGMPVGKQKVQFEGVYVKDTQSIASCAVTPGAVVYLQQKERGGRKK